MSIMLKNVAVKSVNRGPYTLIESQLVFWAWGTYHTHIKSSIHV